MSSGIKINRMIVHFINKTMNDRKEDLIGKNLRNELLPVDGLSIKLVEDLDKEYKRKTAKSYGHFDKVSELDTFESLLEKYCSKKTDKNFIEFTKKSTELFISEISGTAATGGSLFFIDYNDFLGQNLFAVFVLNDKESCGLNKETLSLEESMSLDIEKLNMAVLIYLGKWLNNESDSYLSFAKGLKEITDYFTGFIGCGQYQKNSVATSEVVKAVAKYCEENQYDFPTKRSKEVDLYRYFEKNKNEKKEVTITGISSIIDPENPEQFKNFIGFNDNIFKISDSFLPSKRSYRNWMWKTYSSSQMRLDISRELIENQTVKYDYDTKKLIIDDNDEILRKSIFEDETEST